MTSPRPNANIQAMFQDVDKYSGNLPKVEVTAFSDTISQLLIPYGLKEVYRAATIGERMESVSEHLGSMISLSSWFIRTYDLKFNVLRVMDMISYHDLPELDCGDTPIIPGVDNRSDKDLKETNAAIAIANRMSPSEGAYFLGILEEYKAGMTKEAKFVRAIDKLDADLQFLGQKAAWETWSEEFYRSKREPYYRKVPAISDFYDHLLIYLKTNGYLGTTN